MEMERIKEYGQPLPLRFQCLLDIILLEIGQTYFVVKNRYGTNQQRSFPKDRLDDFLKFPNRDEDFNLV